MRASAVLGDGEDLRELRGQIDKWRRSRARGRAMPEPLWQATCVAARQLGTYRVARGLGVNYDNLKKRLQAKPGDAMPVVVQEPARMPGFIDIGRVGAFAPPTGADQMVVELVAADGTRLTIRTSDASAGVLAMISAFRGRT